MPTSWPKLKLLVPLAVLFLCAHAILISFHLPVALRASYPFMVCTPLFAVFACGWRARSSGPRMRFAWLMVAVSMVIWSEAMCTSALEYFSIHAVGNLAGLSDLLFLLYTVPILLVLSSPMEGQRALLFVWLDAAQAICAGCLIYVLIFSTMPFQSEAPTPVSMPLVVTTYNVVNFLLAAAATLRMLMHSSSREEGRLYRALASFLWLYAICAAVNNYVVSKVGDRTGYFDLLADPAFLLLAVWVMMLPATRAMGARRLGKRRVARYLDNASPIVYTTTLLVLSAINVRKHFTLGMVDRVGAGGVCDSEHDAAEPLYAV